MLKHFRNRKGFTLVEILIVVVMLAILFAIAVPIYISYVASARSAEAQEGINAVKSAAKIFHARNGAIPNNVQQLQNLLEFEEVTNLRWTFNIIPAGQGIGSITATSLGAMPGGAGKTVRLNVRTGEWSGYGFDSN